MSHKRSFLRKILAIAALAAEPALDAPAEFGAYVRAGQQRWARVVRDAKVTLE